MREACIAVFSNTVEPALGCSVTDQTVLVHSLETGCALILSEYLARVREGLLFLLCMEN